MSTSKNLADSVSAYLQQFESEKIPAGWHTQKELGKMLGVAERQASRITKRFVEHKQAEIKNFRIKSGRCIRPVPHCKFSRSAKKALGIK